MRRADLDDNHTDAGGSGTESETTDAATEEHAQSAASDYERAEECCNLPDEGE